MTKDEIKGLIEDSKRTLADTHDKLGDEIKREIADYRKKALKRT